MRVSVIAASLLAAGSLVAQAPGAPAEWKQPDGWTIRLDEKDAASKPADTKFQTMGQGFHVTSGPAALYYRATDQAKGAYTVKAQFGQRVKPMHPEAYGVFIGGTDVADNARQQYMYLLVRGDGKYFVAHRAGKDVHKIVDWTDAPAVVKENERGSATNEVAIQVAADAVNLMVNGTTVKSFKKSELHGFNTDGQFGLRLNHGLNVHIANFGMTQ